MSHIKKLRFVGVAMLFISGCATTSNDTNLNVKKSLPNGFQPWGVMTVTSTDGYPTRTGDSSIRFEVRNGDCSQDSGWSDCKNDRQRHEYTTPGTSGNVWFNWSLFIPEDFPSLQPATVSLGQFHQRGGNDPLFMFQNSNQFKFQKDGYSVERQKKGRTIENKPIITDEEMRAKWVDILVHANWRADHKGFFRVYVNGETTPRYAYAGSTVHDDGSSVYFKFGIYQAHISRYFKFKEEGSETPTQVVYYDDVNTSSKCDGAALYFDCASIVENEKGISDGIPTNFRRSEKIIVERYSCLEPHLRAQNIESQLIPSQAQIETLGRELANIRTYVSHFKLRQILGADVVNANKDEWLKLVNFDGDKNKYCASL